MMNPLAEIGVDLQMIHPSNKRDKASVTVWLAEPGLLDAWAVVREL